MTGILVILLALAGCGDTGTPSPTTEPEIAEPGTPATTPGEPGPLGMTRGDGAQSCLVHLEDVQVAVEDNAQGAVLVLTGDNEYLDRETEELARLIDESGAAGEGMAAGEGTAGEGTADEGAAAGEVAPADEGAAAPEDAVATGGPADTEVHMVPAMDASVESSPGAARLVLAPTGATTTAQVQAHARVLAQRIQGGHCPMSVPDAAGLPG